jgi:UDP-N-acetylglucosamine acyltransferase
LIQKRAAYECVEMQQQRMIHPTAIIHPLAQVDSTVEVGPYAVIDADVVMGPHCWIGPYVHLTGHSHIGAHNRFHAGCVIGDAPQDLKYTNEPTRLRIGDHNVFREQVTVHRANKLEDDTVMGSNNYLMAHCHVGHNVRLGDYIIMANGALLGGHVIVGDRAIISGNCLVHQFVRVGCLALMQGGAAISKDLPPYAIARGDNGMCGLNVVGLRRNGISLEQRTELKRLYHVLFRRGLKLQEAVQQARREFTGEPARALIEFVAVTKRGICRDTGSSSDGGES